MHVINANYDSINQKYNVLAHTFGFLFPSERHLVDLNEELLSSSLSSSSKQTSLQEKKTTYTYK